MPQSRRGPCAGPQLRLWTNEDLRDAIMALYRSEVVPRDIPRKFNGVSRQTVEAKVKQLEDGLEDTEEKMPLARGSSLTMGSLVTHHWHAAHSPLDLRFFLVPAARCACT